MRIFNYRVSTMIIALLLFCGQELTAVDKKTEYVEQFAKQNFNRFVFGVWGLDLDCDLYMADAQFTVIQNSIQEHIDFLVGLEGYQVFVLTDRKELIDYLVGIHGKDRVISYMSRENNRYIGQEIIKKTNCIICPFSSLSLIYGVN